MLKEICTVVNLSDKIIREQYKYLSIGKWINKLSILYDEKS